MRKSKWAVIGISCFLAWQVLLSGYASAVTVTINTNQATFTLENVAKITATDVSALFVSGDKAGSASADGLVFTSTLLDPDTGDVFFLGGKGVKSGGKVDIVFKNFSIGTEYNLTFSFPAGSTGGVAEPDLVSSTSGFTQTVQAVPLPAALPLLLSAIAGILAFAQKPRPASQLRAA